jgi:hypothetical protein
MMNLDPRPETAPVDLLFVFAGAPWRKEAGIAAWRSGAARTLVLSIARFEWRRFPRFGLPDDGGLVALVEATPPTERHFFLVLRGAIAEARRIRRGRLGTWTEALGLARLAQERGARSVAVCTSGYHLPRALLAVRRAFRGRGLADVAIVPFPVVERADAPLGGAGHLRSPRGWLLLLQERLKWVLYFVVTRFSEGERSGP